MEEIIIVLVLFFLKRCVAWSSSGDMIGCGDVMSFNQFSFSFQAILKHSDLILYKNRSSSLSFLFSFCVEISKN